MPARGDEKRTFFGGFVGLWLGRGPKLVPEAGCVVWEVVGVPVGVPLSTPVIFPLWACWLSPNPVFSVFFPFPRSMGSSGPEDSGTLGISAEEGALGFVSGEEGKGTSGLVGWESGAWIPALG